MTDDYEIISVAVSREMEGAIACKKRSGCAESWARILRRLALATVCSADSPS